MVSVLTFWRVCFVLFFVFFSVWVLQILLVAVLAVSWQGARAGFDVPAASKGSDYAVPAAWAGLAAASAGGQPSRLGAVGVATLHHGQTPPVYVPSKRHAAPYYLRRMARFFH